MRNLRLHSHLLTTNLFRTTRLLALELTPYEVLGIHDTTRAMMGRIAARLRQASDVDLAAMFLGEEPTQLEHYCPKRMTSVEECRSHSWWLACLMLVNEAWDNISTLQQEHQLTEDDEATDIGLLHGTQSRSWPALRKCYAYQRIMGAFIPLVYSTLAYQLPHSDDDWRPRPDGSPSPLDRHFPEQTSCFHAGDMPQLDCIFDQVGFYGVQVVKGKVPLANLVIKAMPVCCQSRELLENLVKVCCCCIDTLDVVVAPLSRSGTKRSVATPTTMATGASYGPSSGWVCAVCTRMPDSACPSAACCASTTCCSTTRRPFWTRSSTRRRSARPTRPRTR